MKKTTLLKMVASDFQHILIDKDQTPESYEIERRQAQFDVAISICSDAHTGQRDKGGKAYFDHPIRVSMNVTGHDEKIVALLHDVVEDSDYTLKDLAASGFSPKQVAAVDAISKRKGEEEYSEYLARIKANPIALAVKIADYTDNLDLTRLSKPLTEVDIKRVIKYQKSLKELKLYESTKRN